MKALFKMCAAAAMTVALAACAVQPGGAANNDADGSSKGEVAFAVSSPLSVQRLTAERAPAAWGSHPDGLTWSMITLDALSSPLGADLLLANPADAEFFCPNYMALGPEERKSFYLGLISKIAEKESGFKPEATVVETFRNAFGEKVTSRGLLQISFESAVQRGACALDNPYQLHDPLRSLPCGVAIMRHFVLRDGVISRQARNWDGAAAYWGVLRTGSKSANRVFDEIGNYTRSLPVCVQ